MIFVIRFFEFIYGTWPNMIGFVPDIVKTLSKFKLEFYIKDYILENNIIRKVPWKRYIKAVLQTFYENQWRNTLNKDTKLSHYRGIHTESGIHPLWTLNLKCPKYTWFLNELIKLPFLHSDEDMKCKLCGSETSDIPVHFLIECHKLCKSRDRYLDQIVNVISDHNYVKFSFLEDTEQCDFLLGNRNLIQLQDEEWETLVLQSSKCISLMQAEMHKILTL